MNIRHIATSGMKKGQSDSASAATDNAELQLIQRIARKDKEAFETLYQLYHQRLARFITPIFRDCSAASPEEIINDTMFVVWRRSVDFRQDSKVSTWIFGIAYRTALSERKKLIAKAAPLSDLEAEQPSEFCKELQRINFQNWLTLAINQLSPEHQAVVRLTYWEGFSYIEIAQTLACPVNTVKTRMHYAKSKLKSLLPQLLGEEAEGFDISEVLAGIIN